MEEVRKPPFDRATELLIKNSRIDPREVTAITTGKNPVAIMQGGIRLKLSGVTTQQPTEQQPKKTDATKTSILPDISGIRVPETTDKKTQRTLEEIATSKAYAKEAAKKLVPIRARIKAIKAIPDWELSTSTAKEMDTLLADEAKILGVPGPVKKHTEFSTLMEEIKEGDTAKTGELLGRIVQIGRFKKEANSETVRGQPNVLFRKGDAYTLSMDTAANRGLMAEIRKLVDKEREYGREVVQKIIEQMKADATPGLTLTRIVQESPIPTGKIHAVVPSYKGMPESHILVECDGKAIKPIAATGRLREFFDDLVKNEAWIFAESLKADSLLLTERLPQNAFDALLRFFKTLMEAQENERQEAPAATDTETTAVPPTAPSTETAEVPVTPATTEKPATEKKVRKRTKKGSK